jgi:signal transduction histidine kinase
MTFRLTLADLEGLIMTVAEQAAEELSPVFEEPLKLLFVDDDPILCEFALVKLASDRGHISVAADGEEALAVIRQNPPDIVLLDLQMPKVDGFEVLKSIRTDEATRRLPVIVITARDDVHSIDRAFAEGATSFVVKPINWRLLTYQIRYVNRAGQTELSLAEHIGEVERRKRELEITSAELATALRGAAAASEAKSQFLATMSHELRTPLNAIIGFSEVLDTQTFGPLGSACYLEYTRAIRDSGSHLLSLINDVLEFSRSSAGKLALCEEEFPPADVIDEAVRNVVPQAKAAKVDLSIDAALGGVRLRGDRRRVRQVLINLLANAVKFTRPGGLVTVHSRREADGLAIVVSDTGIGIVEEDIPKALEQFGQVECSLARKYDGAGLGLPLAKQLMELHDGVLRIESTVDVGTIVTVTFPAERVVSEATA